MSPRCPGPLFLVRQLGQADVSSHRCDPEPVPGQAARTFVICASTRPTWPSIKQLPEGADAKELCRRSPSRSRTAVNQELGIKVVIGIGTVVSHIRDLARVL